MKKLFLIFAITGVVAIDSANAQAIIDQGNCGANGNNLTWVLTDDSTLTINGSGAMANYESPNNNPPWRSYINSSKISYLVIGNSVSSIGNRAFAGCLYLTGTLTIPNSVITIGDGAFYQCSGLSGALNIPNSVTAIGTSAFEYCIGLTGALSISGSVTTIGYSAFGNCESLTSVSVNAANSRYSSKDGILYNKQQDTLIWCPGGKTGTITIPNSVITIAKRAFGGCKNLSGALIIPNTVTVIESYAFNNCQNLTSLTIGESVTTIGGAAFSSCIRLATAEEKLIIPNSVITIGGNAFNACSWKSVTIGESVASIGSWAFANNFDLSSITCNAINPPSIIANDAFYDVPGTIPVCVPVGSLAAYQNSNWGSQFTNIQECEVGMDDVVSKTKIIIYPNPATDYIEIETISQPKGNPVSIYDITGRIIKSQTLIDEITRLDLSTLVKGIYILKIDNQLFKIIKQ